MQGDLFKAHELPFIYKLPDDGRGIITSSFFDEEINKFRLFLPYKDNKIIEMATGSQGPLKGLYWSKGAISKKDLYLGIIQILANHFSFPDTTGEKRGIADLTSNIIQDIHNFGAVIHKQFIIWEYIKSSGNTPSRSMAYDIYATEVEYLMGLIRSFFDLLYNVFIRLSEISEPKMININIKKVNTLGKFSDKVGRDIKASDGKLSQIDVLKSYKLTDDFILFFRTIFPLFRLSRNIRDAIYHSGDSPQIIFITENGPGIGMRDFDPYFGDSFLSFKAIFKNEPNFTNSLLKNDIVSLFYFVNVIIGSTLDYAEIFAQSIDNFYKRLPEKVSNNHIFIRGPEIKYITKIPDYLTDTWLVPLNNSFKPEYWEFLKKPLI